MTFVQDMVQTHALFQTHYVNRLAFIRYAVFARLLIAPLITASIVAAVVLLIFTGSVRRPFSVV